MEEACRRGDFEKVKEVPSPHATPPPTRTLLPSFFAPLPLVSARVGPCHPGKVLCTGGTCPGLGVFVRREKKGWVLATFVFSGHSLPRFLASSLAPLPSLIVSQEPWKDGGGLPGGVQGNVLELPAS